MRKNIIVLAATVVALCACQKNEIELLDKPIVKNDGDKVTYTFTAVIADDVTDIETKATMARTGTYTWAVDDDLKFYKEDGTSAPAKVTAVDGSTATITVTTTDDRSSFVSAIYPASAAAAKDKITFNARGPIVVSAVNGGTLKFYHIGSVINLKFTGIPDGTQSLVFAPTSAFTYDGTFSFSDRKPVLTSSTGSTSKIVVPATRADEGKDISISVPSVVLNGFSAALNNAADGAGRNLFKKSTAESHDLADKCPVLMNMKKVACEPATKYYIKTVSSPINAVDINNYPLIQTGGETFELWVNANINATYSIVDEYNLNNENGSVANGIIMPTTGSSSDEVYLGASFYGSDWDATKHKMTKVKDGLYYIHVDNVGTSPSFKYIIDGGWYGYGDAYFGIALISSGGNLGGLTDNASYDFFLDNTNKRHFPLQNGLGYFQITFNSSTSSVQIFPQWIKCEHAWNNEYFSSTKGLALIGFDDWTDKNLTYSSNHIFSYSGLTIAADGTYSFKIRTRGEWATNNRWGTSDGNSANPGSNLYGTGTTDADLDGESLSITLTAGTYDFYANDIFPWYDDKPLRFMFIKR